MATYETGQRAIYQEDGAHAIVEVMERTLRGDTQMYKLKVMKPLNNSRPDFVAAEGGDKRALEAASFVRGFKPGQELEVSENLAPIGPSICWGVWTLTDLVEEIAR